MQIKAPLLLSACLALARAVRLSADSPNGHYVTITHNAAFEFPTTLTAPPSAKLRLRDLPVASQSGCDSGHFDPGDLAHAQAAMDSWCDSGNRVGSDQTSVFKYNSVVAYICSYGGASPCSKGEEDEAFKLIGQRCRFPAAGGWYFIPDWNKTYGYIHAGRSFCTNL